MFSSIIK
jgi:hypothetical protein